MQRQFDAVRALIEAKDLARARILASVLTTDFPRHGLGWKALGVVFLLQGLLAAALAPMQTAVRLLPRDAEAQSNLGLVLLKLRRFTEAERCLRQALAIDGSFAGAHSNLGLTHVFQGRYAEAEERLRQGLALKPDERNDPAVLHSLLLFLSSNNPEVGAEALFFDHARYADRFETPLRAFWPTHENPMDSERRLRIGFVSGDLRDHAVAYFVEPVLARMRGGPGFELHAYYNNTVQDPVNERLRALFEHWNPVAALSDEALARKVMDDGIDILIDLSGHTARNRLRTFARKPAPVQVSWLGYPGTTGLRAMDYYIADLHWLPAGEFDSQFTEKLVYLSNRWTYQPLASAAAVHALPALTAGYMTFGSFNHPGKINAATFRLWSSLLRAVPQARMLLGGMPAEDAQSRVIEQFAAEGIPRERLVLHARCDTDTYVALHHQVDLCLDTQPYAGGTTTMHALWMGVPTLTIAGPTPFARAGAGILAQLGLAGFTATDDAGFVARGRYWAAHPMELAALRAELRPRVQTAAGDADAFTAEFAQALRHMWRRRCAQLSPESFASADLGSIS